MKTIKFYTLGCKVNQYDTQSIRENFIAKGFKEIYNGQKADVYVINTCTVTQRADRDSLNAINRAKSENPKAKIIVTGCLAELDKEKIKKIGRNILIIKKNVILSPEGAKNPSGITYFKGHTRAFLKIQDGCDNFCSYCKVPLVRGRSISRRLPEIIREARSLVKNGFKEIVLCGICLGSYGKDFRPQKNLVDLIEKLEEIDGLSRIRLSSIETNDVTDALIEKLKKSKKLMPHLHIPIQSGDDQILKKMNRRYRRADYLALIQKIKKNLPLIAITTDVLIGFPGETEENFQNTIRIIKEILPLKVHIFPYSPREGTLAAKFKLEIGPKAIKTRIKDLRKVAQDCSTAYKKMFLNKRIQVLIENNSNDNLGIWEGLSNNYIKIIVISKQNIKNKLIFLRTKKLCKDYLIANQESAFL